MREKILNTIGDLVGDFLYYDRIPDEEVPWGSIEKAVREGVITVDEMVGKFKEALQSGLPMDVC